MEENSVVNANENNKRNVVTNENSPEILTNNILFCIGTDADLKVGGLKNNI